MPISFRNLVRNRHRQSRLGDNVKDNVGGLPSPSASSMDSSGSDPSLNTKSSKRQRKSRKSRNSTGKQIFRRITKSRGRNSIHSIKDGLLKDKIQHGDTFSMSEDDASHVSSVVLFSPVHNNPMAATKGQQLLLSSEQLQHPQFPPFFISQQEQKIKEFKTKLADAMESIETQKAKIAYLQQLVEDTKELHTVDMELKDIELEKKTLEIERLQTELSLKQSEIDEQSKIIEALATSQHESMKCNWFSAPLDLFLDLI